MAKEDVIVSVRRRFIFRPFWFILSQTDGEPYTPVSIPDWEEERALYELHIDRVPFAHHRAFRDPKDDLGFKDDMGSRVPRRCTH